MKKSEIRLKSENLHPWQSSGYEQGYGGIGPSLGSAQPEPNPEGRQPGIDPRRIRSERGVERDGQI